MVLEEAVDHGEHGEHSEKMTSILFEKRPPIEVRELVKLKVLAVPAVSPCWKL